MSALHTSVCYSNPEPKIVRQYYFGGERLHRNQVDSIQIDIKGEKALVVPVAQLETILSESIFLSEKGLVHCLQRTLNAHREVKIDEVTGNTTTTYKETVYGRNFEGLVALNYAPFGPFFDANIGEERPFLTVVLTVGEDRDLIKLDITKGEKKWERDNCTCKYDGEDGGVLLVRKGEKPRREEIRNCPQGEQNKMNWYRSAVGLRN